MDATVFHVPWCLVLQTSVNRCTELVLRPLGNVNLVQCTLMFNDTLLILVITTLCLTVYIVVCVQRGRMVSVYSTDNLAHVIGNLFQPFNWTVSNKPFISLPHKDEVDSGVYNQFGSFQNVLE